MRPKILILPSWYPSESYPTSGVFVEDQALLLAERYDVAVLFPRLVGYREILSWKIGPRIYQEEHSGLRIYSERVLAPVPRKSRWGYKLYYHTAKQKFESLMHTWGMPDIIHAHVVLPAGWAAVQLGEAFSIPVVLTEHSSPFSMHLRTQYGQRLVRKTLLKTNRIVAVSPSLAKQILSFERNVEVAVIGNLIRSDFFKPAESKSEDVLRPTRFLSIALLSKQKGLIFLLEAAYLLVKRGITSFELVIGGDGPERAKLQSRVVSLGLSGHCSFLGAMTRCHVRDQVQKSDVFVLPSLHETFGVVLGEAMACGKPVIATRCGGPEFVITQENGILVDIGDSRALADVMERFIARRVCFDPARVRQSISERFGENAFLEKISDIYKGLGIKGA